MIYKSKHNPFKIVSMFEEEVANYTGAKYAVAVDNCTNALFLCCMYRSVNGHRVYIPSKTYLSVPQSVIHAGGEVVFNEVYNDWQGWYELYPFNIWDAAKRFTSGMYAIPGSLMCLSFHSKKILDIGKGGMVLTDDYEAAEWLKKARYEGRSEKNYKDDCIKELGWNMYMAPEQAARGLTLMSNLPLFNTDLPEEGGYMDLSKYPIFEHCEKLNERL